MRPVRFTGHRHHLPSKTREESEKNTRLVDKRQQTASISFIVACSMFSVSRAAIESSPGDGRERKRGLRLIESLEEASSIAVHIDAKNKVIVFNNTTDVLNSSETRTIFYDIFYKNIEAKICEIFGIFQQ